MSAAPEPGIARPAPFPLVLRLADDGREIAFDADRFPLLNGTGGLAERICRTAARRRIAALDGVIILPNGGRLRQAIPTDRITWIDDRRDLVAEAASLTETA